MEYFVVIIVCCLLIFVFNWKSFGISAVIVGLPVLFIWLEYLYMDLRGNASGPGEGLGFGLMVEISKGIVSIFLVCLLLRCVLECIKKSR